MKKPFRRSKPARTKLQSEQISIDIAFAEPYERTNLPWVMLCIMLIAFTCTIGLDELGKWLGNPTMRAYADSFLNFGALDKRVFAGEVWRFFTSPFLHFNSYHIFGNGATFLVLCYMLRTIYAGKAWLWIFTGSCIFGAAMTVYFRPQEVGIGASIGIAGMLGSMVTSELMRLRERLPRSEYPARVVISLAGLVVVFIIQAVVENLLPQVGHVGHLCGLFVGIMMGLLFARNGKLLIVTGDLSKVRAVYPAAVKSRYIAASYPSVELHLTDDFTISKDYLGFVNVTRGGVFYRSARVEMLSGTLNQEQADAGQYCILGSQYPSLQKMEEIDTLYKKVSKSEAIKNRPWKIAGLLLGLLGANHLYYAYFHQFELDVTGVAFLKTLPAWLEPQATFALGHAGAAILSFMTAHMFASLFLSFLQGALKKRRSK